MFIDVVPMPHNSPDSQAPEVITGSLPPLPSAILFTQGCTGDFIQLVGPRQQIANQVHIGRLESARLMGESGQMIPFLKAAHTATDPNMLIINILDRHVVGVHDRHLEVFGLHGIPGTAGANLVEPIGELASVRPNTLSVAGGDLSDFCGSDVEKELKDLLQGRTLQGVKVGVIGVWTDAKVMNLIYDLSERFGADQIATCSALTASSRNSEHYAALTRMTDFFGVQVFHSPGSFLSWLDGKATMPELPVPESSLEFTKELSFPPRWTPDDKERSLNLMRGLIGQKSATVTQLGGGFSGCLALMVEHVDGSEVVKIGPRDEIGGEFFRNGRIRNVLVNHVPELKSYRESGELAGFSMGLIDRAGEAYRSPTTFQALAQSPDRSANDEAALGKALVDTLSNSMGRLYRVAEADTLDILRVFGFTDSKANPLWANSVVAKSIAVANELGCSDVDQFLERYSIDAPVMSPAEFYTKWLPGKVMIDEVMTSEVHADLNLQNILLRQFQDSGELSHHWVIDFARLTKLPVLTDFAKIENDLSYILCPVDSEEAFERLTHMQANRLQSETLQVSALYSFAKTPEERLYARLVHQLRAVAHEIDPRGTEAMPAYRAALLRYAAHTLGFDEPNSWQRGLALLGCSQLTASIAGEEAARK